MLIISFLYARLRRSAARTRVINTRNLCRRVILTWLMRRPINALSRRRRPIVALAVSRLTLRRTFLASRTPASP
jgi:hypothetical protein